MESPQAGRQFAVLAVDDDPTILLLLDEILTDSGYRCFTAGSSDEALEVLAKEEVALVLTDIAMPGMDGMGLLSQIRESHPDTDVVLTTGVGTIRLAVEAMKRGARDFITKPFEPATIRDVVSLVIRSRRGASAAESYDIGGGETLVGKSKAIRRVYSTLDSLRDSNANVLICGESGTGKELVARALHYGGPVAAGPFVPVNCASIPRSLAESHFFGHIKGAFTGASAEEIGLFRNADGGTLFLDEVTEIPPDFQSVLLRAIQEQQVVPVGSTKPCDVSVRVLAATNRIADGELDGRAMRLDLYHRLAVIRLAVPPLRDSAEDIPLLVEHFNAGYQQGPNESRRLFTPAAMEFLRSYSWPGNVRELQNLVESCNALSKGAWIDVGDLPDHIRRATKEVAPPAAAETQTFEQMERRAITEALQASGGRKTRTAELLGINRQRLYRKLRKYDLL